MNDELERLWDVAGAADVFIRVDAQTQEWMRANRDAGPEVYLDMTRSMQRKWETARAELADALDRLAARPRREPT